MPKLKIDHSILILLLVCNTSLANTSKQKNFQNFKLKNGITLTAAPKSRHLIMRAKNQYLLAKNFKNATIYQLTRETPQKIYSLILKHDHLSKTNKVGLLVTQNRVLKSEICDPKNELQKLKENLNLIAKSTEKSSIIISKSCNALGDAEVSRLEDYISLSTPDSYLQKCLQSDLVEKMSNKFPQLAAHFAKASNRLFTDLNSNEPSLTIACSTELRDNASYHNNVITFPVKDGNLATNPCKDMDAVFTHEYFHHSGVSEADMEYIDSICAVANESEHLKNPKCDAEYRQRECVENQDRCMTSQGKVINEINEISATTILAEQRQLAPIVQQQLQNANVKPVELAESDWSKLSEPAANNSTVSKVASNMGENFSTMNSALNTAIAATTGSSAIAATGSIGIGNSKTRGARMPASAGSRKNPGTPGSDEYVAEEYLADMNTKGPQLPSYANSFSNSAVSATNKSKATPVSAETTGGIDNGIAQATGSGTSLGSSGSASSSASGSAKPAAKNSANRSIASTNDVPSYVNALEKQETISGNQYSEIRRSYSNPDFKQNLKENGITILLNNGSISIGSERSRASIIFLDNGKTLRRLSK